MKASAGKRILMMLENCTYPRDGRARREAVALVRAGYQVAIICPGTKQQPWQEVIDGVRVLRYPESWEGSGLIGYLWEYAYCLCVTAILSFYLLVRRGFDVIHAHNPPDLFVLVAAFYKLLGKRFVFDHHDLSPEMYLARFPDGGNRKMFRMLELLEIFSCRLADRVIATNASYAAVEVERSGIPREKISIVRNGPELDFIYRTEPDPELRSRAKTIIGYVGSLGVQDGLDYLVRSMHRLKTDLGRTDFLCVIIGSGVALDDIRRQVQDLDLTDQVWCPGYVSQSDLRKYLSTSDIFVDPDPSNSFNDRSTMIKILEYMTLERPIVAFDLPEHRVSAGDSALYARPNDELDFAAKIAQLMDDPALRERMGQIGKQRIDESLAWPHQVKSLLTAYAAVFPQASSDETTGAIPATVAPRDDASIPNTKQQRERELVLAKSAKANS